MQKAIAFVIAVSAASFIVASATAGISVTNTTASVVKNKCGSTSGCGSCQKSGGESVCTRYECGKGGKGCTITIFDKAPGSPKPRAGLTSAGAIKGSAGPTGKGPVGPTGQNLVAPQGSLLSNSGTGVVGTGKLGTSGAAHHITSSPTLLKQ